MSDKRKGFVEMTRGNVGAALDEPIVDDGVVVEASPFDLEHADAIAGDLIDIIDTTALTPEQAIPALMLAAVYLVNRLASPGWAADEAMELFSDYYDEFEDDLEEEVGNVVEPQ